MNLKNRAIERACRENPQRTIAMARARMGLSTAGDGDDDRPAQRAKNFYLQFGGDGGGSPIGSGFFRRWPAGEESDR